MAVNDFQSEVVCNVDSKSCGARFEGPPRPAQGFQHIWALEMVRVLASPNIYQHTVVFILGNIPTETLNPKAAQPTVTLGARFDGKYDNVGS